MRFIIIDQLSCLAHIKHSTQPSNFWLILQTLSIYIQYLALLLPQDGWNIWSLKDGHFKLIQDIAQSQLVISLLSDSAIDFDATAFVATLIVLFCFIIILMSLMIFSIINSHDPAEHYSLRIILYYFLQLIQGVLQLPLLFLFISQIITGDKTLNFQDNIFNFQTIINFFTILLYSTMIIIQQFVLRAYTFVPFNYLQIKYNGLQVIFFILNIAIAIFYYVDNSISIQYVQLVLIHIVLVLRMIESIFNKPYISQLNKFNFIFSTATEFINIIITINVVSRNSVIPDQDLLIAIMLAGAFGFYFSQILYNRKNVNLFLEGNYQGFACIPYAQQMHFNYQKVYKNYEQKEFFELFISWKSHKIHCGKLWIKKHKKKDQNCIQLTYQTINCMLQTELESVKLDSKFMYEELQLVFINYVAEFAAKPLLAYVELKKYETIQSQQSYFFKIIRQQMSLYLQKLVLKQQQIFQQQNFQQNQLQLKQLTIQDIFESLSFQEEIIPKVREIVQQKIGFWTNQIKGFSSIYEVEKMGISQSKNILLLQNKIKKFFNEDIINLDHVQFTNNVLNIKLLSIFYSVVLNDYYGTQICEQSISEIFNIEHTQSEDIVTNLSLVQESAVLILLSMVKSRGKIVNSDRRLIAKYFDYDDQDFLQIDNISNMMPKFFGEKHDKLLQDYLLTAKSIFFDDYKVIFGKNRDGTLVPQQLKIDHDFSFMDDYVLIGCMSQIKHSSDFVLIGEDGYLLGSTTNFFTQFIQDEGQRLQIDQINLLNVYMIFPNILDILIDTKNRFRSESQYNIQDRYCRIWKFTNIKELVDDGFKVQQTIRQLSTNIYDRTSSLQKSRTSATSFDANQTKNLILSSKIELNQQQQKLKSINYLQQLPIYNPLFQANVLEQVKKMETKAKSQFICRIDIQYRTICSKSNMKAYFILEINDIRRTDETKTNESLMNNPYSLSAQTTTQILGTTIFNTSDPLEQQGENLPKQTESNIESTPVEKEQMQRVNDIQQWIQKFQQNHNHDINQYGNESGRFFGNESGRLFGNESARDSLHYGPLSQKIHFISPSSKQQQLEGLIEKDFIDLQLQLEYGGAGELINDIDQPEPSQIKGNSNSNQQQDKSNNIIKLIQDNQQHKRKGEFEISAKRSRSSVTSGTSGISAIQVIKKFQQKTDMTTTLQTLFLINLLILLTVIIYIVVHLINVNSYNDSILQTLSNINAPVLFNRYFCKTFCYVWSLIFNSFQIIDSSDYIIIQTIKDIDTLANTMLASIRSMYSTFIQIEVSGLLSSISLDFLYQDNESVTYTYFINFICNLADYLFQAQYYTIDNLQDLIESRYLDYMLTLRYNLKNVVAMNTELLDSLNTIFFSSQESKLQEFQIQISLEIVILGLIVFLQIYYWHQLEKYCQQIVLLIGRLQETQAQEMILRFSYINETLLYLSGKISWKQQNYYRLVYLPLNQLGIETLQSQSRIIKDYQLQINSNKQNLNPIIGGNQKKVKKNLSVVLNSRIANTTTTIIKPSIIVIFAFIIFLTFIVGGYILYNSQQQDLNPTQQLALQFIRFTSLQDITISSAFITKSQPALYPELVQSGFYTQSQIDSFSDEMASVKLFLQYYDIYYENLTDIYSNIIASNKMNGDDEIELLTLYQDDYCILLSDDLPFCNYNSSFASIYGEPFSKDNNQEFFSQGIQGIVSRIDNLFKQNYQYEIANQSYNDDVELILEQMNTQEFTNAIFEHFLDSTEGTNLFIDKIMDILRNVMLSDLQTLFIYYLSSGIPILLIYILLFGQWLYSTNKRLIQLRLVLTNLPVEILTEPHTLTLLKRLK